MANDAETQYAGDWLKWMAERRYCLVVDTITAVGAAVVGIDSGQIMMGAAGAKVLNSGGPATAILVEPVSLAEHIAGCDKLMLIRGPAVCDSDELVVDDPSDLTDLAALSPPILCVNSALTTWTTQTT